MVDSITFKQEVNGDSPKEQVKKWTKGMDRSNIISVTMHEDGNITLFFWD